MNFKLFSIRIVIIVSILFVADVVIGTFARNVHDNYYDSTNKIEYLRQECKEEVILMGGSRCAFEYNPQIISDSLSESCYNCGINGNGIITAYANLRFLLKHYKPKLILYDVFPETDIKCATFDNNCIYYIDNFKKYYDEPFIESILRDISYAEWVKTRCNLYRYNGQLLGFIKTTLADSKHTEKKVGNGFDPQDRMGVYDENSEHNRMVTDIDSQLKLLYVQKFITLCKENNIQLIFSIAPSNKKDLGKEYQAIFKICKSYKIPLLNYLTDKRFSKQDFFDFAHMNAKGADKFSKIFAHDLNEYFHANKIKNMN